MIEKISCFFSSGYYYIDAIGICGSWGLVQVIRQIFKAVDCVLKCG